MSYTYTVDVGNGIKTVFPFSFAGQDEGYLSVSNIQVLVAGTSVPFNVNRNDPNKVYLNSAPPVGSEVLIRRIMPKNVPFTDFSRGNPFSQDALNDTNLQQLYIVQEILDGFLPVGFYWKQDLNMGGHKIVNMAPGSQDGDATNWEQLQEQVSWNNTQDMRLNYLESQVLITVGTRILSVKDFGAKGDGVTDDAPAFRAAIGSNRKVLVPTGVYLFNSTLGGVPGVASAPCVVIDGVQDFTFQGEGNPIILMGDNMAATPGNSFILAYTSAASANSGKHTRNININGISFRFKRIGVSGNIAGCNFTSVDGGGMYDVEFDGRGFAPTLGIPGTGSRNLIFNKVRFKGISTCFDNSQLINCRMIDCILDAAGYPVVTGFGHFYDTNTLANIRLDPPPPNSLGYGNLYKNNEIIGYGSPFSIRGMRYSLILDNIIHESIFSDDTTRNMVSLFTESKEVLAGFNSGCISVINNIIYNCRNEKNTAAAFRGVFINRIGGPFDNPHVSNNTIVGLFGGTGPHIGISMTGSTNGDVITDNNVSAATPYGRSVIQVFPGSTDGASPSVVASSGDVVLRSLEPGRFVRFGTNVASPDAPVSGYITIRDELGTERKLAVIT